jgi:hypothetical protein
MLAPNGRLMTTGNETLKAASYNSAARFIGLARRAVRPALRALVGKKDIETP